MNRKRIWCLVVTIFVVYVVTLIISWRMLPDLDALFHNIDKDDVFRYKVFCLLLGGLMGILVGWSTMFLLLQPAKHEIVGPED